MFALVDAFARTVKVGKELRVTVVTVKEDLLPSTSAPVSKEHEEAATVEAQLGALRRAGPTCLDKMQVQTLALRRWEP